MMAKQKLVADVLRKGRFIRLSSRNTLSYACRVMLEHHVQALLIHDGNDVVGVVTGQDINFRAIALGRDPNTTPLADIMTPNPDTLPATTFVKEALELMRKNDYSHLPIIGPNREIIGVVSIHDLLSALEIADCKIEDRKIEDWRETNSDEDGSFFQRSSGYITLH